MYFTMIFQSKLHSRVPTNTIFWKKIGLVWTFPYYCKNIENACVDFDYLQVDHHLSKSVKATNTKIRSRCDARERLVDVGRLRYPYVTFYIMPVCHLQNFHLHWQFQIWFKISKYFHVQNFVTPRKVCIIVWHLWHHFGATC